jgi:hypothetical protein
VNRKLLYISTIILTLAGCASEDYIGDQETRRQNENGKAISLNLTAAPQTRSAKTGAEAASDLNNNFVIWGEKTMSDNSTQTVFDNYQVNYLTNSANTTTSNSAGWEYVGYTSKKSVEQSIKFWDYSAAHYDFFTYSLGKGDTPNDLENTTYATASEMTTSGYTLSGSADQLKACYITNKETVIPSGSSSSQVQLEFMNFASNVKMAFYETMPGYSVKSLEFYPAVNGTAGTVPYLYASTSSLPTAGTYTISFDTNGKAQVSAPASATNTTNLYFGTALTYTADKEYQEAAGLYYIGRSSDAATPTTAVTVLPNPNGTDLHLKINYILLTRDGLGETIHVTGATATVPAAYTQWKPNHSYTYLFKISDNTNGLTNPDVATKIGLSPITLDAVVNVGADGTQETVTTVTDPSITTYQKGSDYATTNEYKAGTIYVVVTTSAGTVATLTTTNAKLYAVTADDVTPYFTEASFSPDATKDDNGNTINIEEVTANLTLTNKIAVNDSPDGKEISFGTDKIAKFTASENTIYVFEYTYTDNDSIEKILYKVIKVAPAS